MDVAQLQSRRGKLDHQQFKTHLSSNSVHPVVALPQAVLGRAIIDGQSRERTPSLIAAASTPVQLLPTVQDDQHLEQGQQLQSLQHIQHKKLVTFSQPGRESEMSGEEGEEEREGRMVEATTVEQMLKESENYESDRMSSQMRSSDMSDMSSSEEQSVEKSELSESVKEMTIFSEDPMENAVVAVDQTDESVERSSFNLRAEEMMKPADSAKENTTVTSPKKDLLEEKLASLQRQLDATLKQLATSKRLEPATALNGGTGQVFEGAKIRLLRQEPKNLVRWRQEEELEPRRLVRPRTNVLRDGEGSRTMGDTTGEDGRAAMMFTQTNSVQEEPIRYFYFI